jgi:hypothetical protein
MDWIAVSSTKTENFFTLAACNIPLEAQLLRYRRTRHKAHNSEREEEGAGEEVRGGEGNEHFAADRRVQH